MEKADPKFRAALPRRKPVVTKRTATGPSPGLTSRGTPPSGAVPPAECQPKSKWVKGSRRNPLIPRESKWFRSLYKGRAPVEREFGRLKNEYGLAPLRVRGIERVALHTDLVMLARLASALARAVPLAA
jgi:hypothetical protein